MYRPGPGAPYFRKALLGMVSASKPHDRSTYETDPEQSSPRDRRPCPPPNSYGTF